MKITDSKNKSKCIIFATLCVCTFLFSCSEEQEKALYETTRPTAPNSERNMQETENNERSPSQESQKDMRNNNEILENEGGTP